MNIKTTTRLLTLVIVGALSSSCATQRGSDTAIGAGVGAASGAAIGAIFGGGKGAAIGAASGAAVGGVTGYNWQGIRNKLSGATKGTGTEITEQPDGSLKMNIPSSVTFDTNSYAIKPSFSTVLQQVAQTLNQNQEVSVRIVGHTDSTGQASSNQTLSVNRAQSVLNVLAQNGVAYQRLSAVGVGSSQPVASNSTEAGRAQNRRVEIYLSVPR